MYLLIVFLPLLGSSVAGFFGRFLGSEGTAIMTTTCVSFSSILSLIAFYEVAPGASACYLRIAPWISSEMFDASWGFLFDSPTVVMLIVVTSISSLVHLYSISYMSEDPHSPRFMCYLSILTFFMPMLVTGDNSLQLFLGWEGVGLASYLLIHFWFTRLQADKAATKAMPVNRVGDFGLAPGISGRFTLFQTVDFSTIFARASAPRNSWISCNMRFNAITLICILLFIGAVGKSAQIGLHTWSPDAMEGPTPVSASIHAATMVTAGVFMIARCSPLFEYPPTALIVITSAGATTSFLAATTGILQNDLKRVIAYSTCSQLGYMIFACGISNYSVSVFHLMNHAFFKALLFLSAGSVIHAMSDEQDMRKMGGLASSFPFTYAMMLMGSLSLIGFPFLTGFYSKDVILELAYTKYTISGNFAFWLGSVSVLFTSYYSFRLLFLTFLVPTNSFGRDIVRCHDAPIPMAIPSILLALGSLFVGYLAKVSNFWANSPFVLPKNEILAESEFAAPTITKLIPIPFSTSGASVAYNVNPVADQFQRAFQTSTFCNRLYSFFNKRWFFDQVLNDFLVRSFLRFGYEVSFEALDKGAIEILGPYGISYTFRRLAERISQLQSGFVYHYAFAMLLGLTLFVTFSRMWDSLSSWVDNRSSFILIVSSFYNNKSSQE
uniref:NADH-ubiquinone oxidoreductase chain 5 n=3 Tax=Maleae TaxID=721813 RepID=A0A5Q3A7X6_9ROSA|nr:NADH dehydrogenase subunit 5 [Eriobotrya japonica]YP_009994932.1 NADH dehydrogenase subunit 5 [Sorbus aucuparia]YP_010047104.1 NADH dehydrogenase subunit 5 [Pyrus betulifolia]YP_010437876.1 NADH dehydrogenase subunit 5 [Pyrus x bretschneideri]QGI24955.1 NADH dehydrogenase subunit 5 [Eriobotrya japonica]QNP09226.1 NADH dehydrogenase subunit 5 [Sorbus aucuparia]QPJ79525.1 NADH dehydrogenase subunit 5 [Pyrus betulifolia]UTB64130.1 NADH dehydrogenase subunit 5 [Pyrus x bretschneideri]UTB6522